MGGTQHRVANSRVSKKVADKYRRKYAKDIKYLRKQNLAEESVYDNHKKESVVEVHHSRTAEIKTEIRVGKRYLMDYEIVGAMTEKIEGKCVWTDGEYFMIKVGTGTRTLRVKYVTRIKEIR